MTEFPFRFPPMAHQAEEFERHKDDDARGLLWQMRTGKTKAVLDLACYRFESFGIDGVLVLAPNGVHDNWVRKELPKHIWEGIPYQGLAWDAQNVDRLWFKQQLEEVIAYREGLAVLAINSETLISKKAQTAIKRFMRMRRVLLAVDESDDFRTPGSSRTRLARGLAKRCRVRRILTGTVVDNSPLAAFSQFELLEPGALGFTRFDEFKARYAHFVSARTRGGRAYDKLENYRNLDELQANMGKWASVVLREDVDDMPELLHVTRTVPLTSEQVKAYNALREDLLLQLNGEVEIEAVDSQVIKLQQVLGGFIMDEVGQVHSIVAPDKLPRLQVLLRELEDTPKAVVWCQFREDIRRVCSVLKAAGRRIVEYHGGIAKDDRAAALDAIQGESDVILIGQPQAGGRGLEMPVDAIIWYSHTSNLITRRQADERGTKVGGKSVSIVDLEAPNTRDTSILQMQAGRRETADGLAGPGLKAYLRRELKEMAPL